MMSAMEDILRCVVERVHKYWTKQAVRLQGIPSI
jgi:hypothetical protein